MEMYGYEFAREDDLNHHGILGQKWGKRNGPPYPLNASQKSSAERKLNSSLDEQTRLTTKSRTGDEIVIEQEAHNKFHRLLARGIKSVNENMLNTKIMQIKVNNKTVGDVQLYQESPDSINGVWLGIKNSERGKGYAQAALAEVLQECKRRGYKQFTLEVPGNSPDARHIYEKMGFKVVRELSTQDEDFVWGGLTAMRLDLANF